MSLKAETLGKIEKRCLEKLPPDAQKEVTRLKLCPCSAWAIYHNNGYVALLKHLKG